MSNLIAHPNSVSSDLERPISESVAYQRRAEKRALADQVTDELREYILRGRFKPGEHLLEEELSEELNVSRGPVRQAITQLELEGLVTVHRNRGAFVARLSSADAADVHTLRVALERLAVQSAVQRATNEDLAALELVIDSMKQAQNQGLSQHQAAELDIKFHDLLYSSAHHERLAVFWSNLRSQVYILILSAISNNADYGDQLASSHNLVLDALNTRNPNLATRIVEDHLAREFELVQTSYTQVREGDTSNMATPRQRSDSTPGKASIGS